ncbi:hypothetical protein GCM10027275_51190 [Rhabdobacter roseus]|uniref:Radical SAM core domain-containing protein n=1 Tax=Rhabdobacter roseus TaxID=1655419 RepID=A0A840U0U4_9BACT|nr:radical SAM protein [Rhabdobacter roseus]MBB5287193.1 uncharacterized protein [Rhabdobacter roseus]
MSAVKQRVRGLVLKVASRCNLNCTYCYVYNRGDTTYRTQPKFMAPAVVEQLLRRVGTYCRAHRLRAFKFIFHGGEPLLALPSFFEDFVLRARRYLPAYTAIDYTIQTNGVLLTEDWCALLGRLGVKIGISLDGPRAVHDAQRVDHQGRGSYEAVVRGFQTAQAHPAVRYYPGLLTVVDPATDPRALFHHFVRLGARSINFLLPDHTHATYLSTPQSTPYADWLIAVFDEWLALAPAVRPKVPLFRQYLALILGQEVVSDSCGRGAGSVQSTFLVIETDGSIEAQDSLKVCYHGITKEGFHVQSHGLDEVLRAPLIRQCAESRTQLPPACRSCPVVAVCGGGFIVHRFRPGAGFDQPSVYCHDLLKLITHIQNRLLAQLPAAFKARTGLAPLGYEEALRLVAEPGF